MNDIHSDDELQTLKRWWDENGTSLLLTIAVAIGGIFGWNWWQASQQQKLDQSFMQFQALVDQVEVLRQNPGDEVQIASVDFQAEQLKY